MFTYASILFCFNERKEVFLKGERHHGPKKSDSRGWKERIHLYFTRFLLFLVIQIATLPLQTKNLRSRGAHPWETMGQATVPQSFMNLHRWHITDDESHFHLPQASLCTWMCECFSQDNERDVINEIGNQNHRLNKHVAPAVTQRGRFGARSRNVSGPHMFGG